MQAVVRDTYPLKKRTRGVTFTKREVECLKCLVLGMSMKEIATELNISCRTVESHLKNIKKKTNCYSRSGLVQAFLESYARIKFYV